MNGKRIGYGRVSTRDQDLDAQFDALVKAGVEDVFVEKVTGSKKPRPQLDALKMSLAPGDTVVVTKVDRLGRSARDLLNLVNEFEALGVGLEVLDQQINTKTPEGKMFFTMVAAFAEFEHSLIVSRTMDGLAAARARGRLGGRKPKLDENQKLEIVALYSKRELTVQEIADLYDVSRPTIYRVIEN